MPDTPHSTVSIRFDPAIAAKEVASIVSNLSGAVIAGPHLWLGGDEGTGVERLTRDADGGFSGHERFDLAEVLGLSSDDGEIDIEGMDVDGGCLWLVGSHSLKRKKPEADKKPADNIARLGKVSADGNRFTLARVPLSATGEPTTTGSVAPARLRGDAQGNVLLDTLRSDPHLGWAVPSVQADGSWRGGPSKDNGLDVEGLAVTGDRVFIGLRGPVLRGWAVVLELRVGTDAGSLTLEPIPPTGALVRRHFLDLDGLGVRDLVRDGSDLLILAGPTMDLDGPTDIYRWKCALSQAADSLTFREQLQRVASLPFGEGSDHAEALTFLPGDPRRVLVSYDSPQASRIKGDTGNEVVLDVFELAT
ncbi:hypothetical protein TBR22_A05830 [Luteitalea sp. TBR-22]|uniref:DUF3616 domain-containing protein n=1 Tax=Luteitalea sp. TBR-22 TaxID=2802971 RepID=UPI001AFC9D1A|nr:DUF3616 domain-containing protein [Luteitalea sp. TBR-22]BCS31383.1 hypothetical protein TBR22_A05830 [Luteitalea sp. TBR-22]